MRLERKPAINPQSKGPYFGAHRSQNRMASSRRAGPALLILFTFQLCIVTLHADTPAFGPLIRERSRRIRERTSEEELNTTIGRIYRKDLLTIPTAKDDESEETVPTHPHLDLATRSSTGHSRGRQPIDSKDALDPEKPVVVRLEDGSLSLTFSKMFVPVLPPAPVDEHPAIKVPDDILVLRVAKNASIGAGKDGNGTDMFEKDSYPADYPFEALEKILKENQHIYDAAFDKHLKLDDLKTRISSPSDEYLCSSERRLEYPTYNQKSNNMIVNMPGFFQGIMMEFCHGTGEVCSNSNTDSEHELRCEQVYSQFSVFTLPQNEKELKRVELKFPSCCKCKHVPKARGNK
uniref:Spaetzle domain-containing protein n=1 Tax=Anopheles farauti TaxID=69004 RepID=A0A182QKM4_9DIPT